MSSPWITKELFDTMAFDVETGTSNASTTIDDEPIFTSALIIFSNSDINAAVYHLIESLKSPFANQAIATVLVQESIKEDFIDKLVQQGQNSKFSGIAENENYNNAVEVAKSLKAEIIVPFSNEKHFYKPCIVCDFTHEQLGSNTPSGIVTLHTFRTVRDAIGLINKESLQFTNVSIWEQNHGNVYEFVAQLKSRNFFLNCHLKPLDILSSSFRQKKSYVVMDKSYHYETFQYDGIQKTVTFPFGNIYVN